jgi:hypothetical protein
MNEGKIKTYRASDQAISFIKSTIKLLQVERIGIIQTKPKSDSSNKYMHYSNGSK